MGNRYGKILTRPTPQSEPLPGRESAMGKNDAGGYAFVLDEWKMLERFLILGTEGGTYYVNEDKHTKRNTRSLQECIVQDPIRVAHMVRDISVEGRAFKNDPAELVLAKLIETGGSARSAGWSVMQDVIRTGRTLLEFNALIDALGVKWSMSRRKAFARWYDEKSGEQVAYQVLKYASAQNWTHRDLLRLAHPSNHPALYKYIVGKPLGEDDRLPNLVAGWEAIKKAKHVKEVIAIIEAHKLTWELVPGEWQGDVDVWQALLPNLPYTALIRNLGRMTSYGLLKGVNDNVKLVRDKLTNREGLRRARVHPMQALVAWRAYHSGGQDRAFVRANALTWTANKQIEDALEDAFYLAFDLVEPSGKSMFMGIDVSGSMGMGIMNLPISCGEAATVLAMVAMRNEKNSLAYGFDKGIRDMGLSAKDTFASAFKKFHNVNGGGTDCSLPMVYALENGLDFDQFVVLTDNETWAGNIHPSRALEVYREKTGIDAKLVVVGMTSSGFSIADPADAGMLDVVGFSTQVPALISKFAQGL